MKRFTIAAAAVLVLGLTSTALASGGLSGKYKTTIHSSAHSKYNGTYVINFTSGAYHVSVDGHAVVHGHDSISGHTITFTKETGGCTVPGVYTFKLTGNKLKFTKVSDSNSSACAGRVFVLSHTFTKVTTLVGGY